MNPRSSSTPPVRPLPKREPGAWAVLDQCATAMAILDDDLVVRMANQAVCEGLGSASRNWRALTNACAWECSNDRAPRMVAA
jgi:hypothetical protein